MGLRLIQYVEGVGTAGYPHLIYNTSGLDIGRGQAEDIDLLTVDEGSDDGSKPRFYWDESEDAFATNKEIYGPTYLYLTAERSAILTARGASGCGENVMRFSSDLLQTTDPQVAFYFYSTVNKGAGDATLIKLDITDTASPGTLNLMDLQVDGVSKFKVGEATLFTPLALQLDADVSWLPATDNTWSIGSASYRLKLLRAVTITSGDFAFENGYYLTEAEGDGIKLCRPDGSEVIMWR